MDSPEGSPTGCPTPCSTRSTRSPSRTRTGTGSGTCPAHCPIWTTWPGWGWTRSGSTRASPPRSGTRATTCPTTSGSRRGTARNDDMVALRRRRPASAASGSCSTSSPGTPRPSTSGSGARPRTRTTTATSGPTGPARTSCPPPARARATTCATSTTPSRRSTSATPGRTRTSPGGSPSTPPGRGPTGRRCGRSSRSGWTAACPASASTWRTRWSRTTRTSQRRRRCGPELQRLDARGLPGRGAAAGERRPGARSTSACAAASTPTSSSSSTPRTARCSTTAAPARCPGCPTTSAATSTPTAEGAAELELFLKLWDDHHAGAGADRLVVMGSADHDYSRLATGTRTREQLGAAYAFLLTWGTVPAIYYGDEIGMRYLPGLPDKEGSIYDPGLQPQRLPQPDAVGRRAAQRRLLHRTGRPALPAAGPRPRPAHRRRPARRSRLPAGTAAPADPAAEARRRHCGRPPPTTVLTRGYPLAYLRGDDHLVVVNPGPRARLGRAAGGRDAVPRSRSAGSPSRMDRSTRTASATGSSALA